MFTNLCIMNLGSPPPTPILNLQEKEDYTGEKDYRYLIFLKCFKYFSGIMYHVTCILYLDSPCLPIAEAYVSDSDVTHAEVYVLPLHNF